MSERMTESNLLELETGFKASATQPETANVSAQLALQIVAEVRRLRGLIAFEDDKRCCGYDCSGPTEDFNAEAEAIRKEQA